MPNREFWDRRYQECPELGSGPGSRGFVVLKKRKLVLNVLRKFSATSVLDIGCGDLCWLNDDFFKRYTYTGLDISSIVIEKNRKLWPGANFFIHDIVAEPAEHRADLVVCFDVLIHQINYQEFRRSLSNTIAAAGVCALISYRKPASKAPSFFDGDGLDPAARVLEDQYQSMRKSIGKVLSMPATYHGEIDLEVSKLFPNSVTTKVDAYRHQYVYLVTGLG
ncbi:trans-aconitate 2-methyltransferase [Accumulibacter sp.]|uniref:class I SAM-dependent methyltransferase n=1 Tax=Accumulibacter sp. TaxID=2053492 RepID=UPI002630D779|nr:class I SAM-dependent methyltransferase [Accumulibacter sp.]